MTNVRVTIPFHKKITDEQDKSFTVFSIDVSTADGRNLTVERRYSEFEELHKKLRGMFPTPEFPPKKILKWNPKVLDQRRLALEAYLQELVIVAEESRLLLQFLSLHRYGNDATDATGRMSAASNTSTLYTADTDCYESSTASNSARGHRRRTHQDVITFPNDAFLTSDTTALHRKGSLPDIVVHGVIEGLYG